MVAHVYVDAVLEGWVIERALSLPTCHDTVDLPKYNARRVCAKNGVYVVYRDISRIVK